MSFVYIKSVLKSPVFQEFVGKIGHGFGFGFGMGIAFKVLGRESSGTSGTFTNTSNTSNTSKMRYEDIRETN